MTSADSTKKELECAVCMEPCAKLSITCCNGHMVCEKHYLQRAEAVYDEGREPFSDKEHINKCFLCRTDIPTEEFSIGHNKKMTARIAKGVFKNYENKTGIVLSKEERNKNFRQLALMNDKISAALQQDKEL